MNDNFFEEKIRIARLYDCYGSLLTERQKACMEYYFYQDLSLAEIAESLNVSRQAVHDMLKRSERLLKKHEDKLGFLRKKEIDRKKIEKLRDNLNLFIEEYNLQKTSKVENMLKTLEELISEDR